MVNLGFVSIQSEYVAAKILCNMSKQKEPLLITQNKETRTVLQNIKSYKQTQETMALLKILTLGIRQIEEGKVQSSTDVIEWLRRQRKER